MKLRQAFSKALRQARKAQGLTQEDFDAVSSRTYLSSLERGLKSPTLDKIDQLAQVIGIHPLAMLLLCYAEHDHLALDTLVTRIQRDAIKVITAVEN